MRATLLLLFWVGGVLSGMAQSAAQKELVVGTREAPPFVIKKGNEWSGLSIDLWRETAKGLGIAYTFREMPTPDSLIEGVAAGELDAAVAAITVTAGRAEKVDFTQPYFNSGLGIVVRGAKSHGWTQTLREFLSLDFLKVLVALTGVLLAAAVGVWFFERKANASQFGGSVAKGLGAAFWWSAVTMTTVGYGDKAPQTTGGRAVALVWMFTSIVIISGFTAQIAASLTVKRLNTEIQGPADLPRFSIATVGNSIAAHYLKRNDVPLVTSGSLEEMLAAVETGRADAGVYDEAILKYALRNRPEFELLPTSFAAQDYAIALPLQSPLRKRMNIALLRVEQGDLWPLFVEKYLGKEAAH